MLQHSVSCSTGHRFTLDRRPSSRPTSSSTRTPSSAASIGQSRNCWNCRHYSSELRASSAIGAWTWLCDFATRLLTSWRSLASPNCEQPRLEGSFRQEGPTPSVCMMSPYLQAWFWVRTWQLGRRQGELLALN